MAAALKMVRDEMGGDAVVLKTRVLPVGTTMDTVQKVEVTACIDEAVLSPGKIGEMLKRGEERVQNLSQAMTPGGMDNILHGTTGRVDLASQLDKKLETTLSSHGNTQSLAGVAPLVRPIYLDLLDADVPVEIARQLIEDLEKKSGPDICKSARDVLADCLKRFISDPPDFKPGMRVIFAGPSGAGKTSAMAKLATRLVAQQHLKVTLSSLDDMKVAAYEEIGGYADILNLPVTKVNELENKPIKDAVILIDTPPIPSNHEKRIEFLNKIKAVKPDCTFLVFSVCCRSRDLLDSVNNFEAISPDYLIAGHLDETERWGGIFTMGSFTEIPLAYTANSPGGIGELGEADADLIAGHILNKGGAK